MPSRLASENSKAFYKRELCMNYRHDNIVVLWSISFLWMEYSLQQIDADLVKKCQKISFDSNINSKILIFQAKTRRRNF